MAVSDKDLIEAASAVQKQAYCEYSGFYVGAALLDEQGRMHVGCNVENSAYPLGSCAEAGAIAAMVANGGRTISVIAVVGGNEGNWPCTPCGGCRQRIHEFADEHTRILVLDDSKEWKTYSIAELLPASFHLPQ
jgi:cytidine deaminase